MNITITTNLDFTPAGKRTVRAVMTYRGGLQIRGYVGGHRFCTFASQQSAIDWRDNTRGLCPQPWSSFA